MHQSQIILPPDPNAGRLAVVHLEISDELLRRRLCDSAVAATLALKVGHKPSLNRFLDAFSALRKLYLSRHPDADIDRIIVEERARAKIQVRCH